MVTFLYVCISYNCALYFLAILHQLFIDLSFFLLKDVNSVMVAACMLFYFYLSFDAVDKHS